jgi:hypothetical protein
MSKSLQLLIELINEDKITIQEVLEACGYDVDVVCTDVYEKQYIGYGGYYETLIGCDEKIVATKEFR